ncbi:hypothetical protein EJ06DRAFT_257748 [Trichodelitschia bisporula]|uniref:Uncharacterized protein n=1 Tax=Trichodelitschia bisporula TaxID=703511 RepID=A0A6G1HJD8_9PEZI|nr:hypothetical protein EJ06DRAFT_257748 [Trichodelitschia bisporula]
MTMPRDERLLDLQALLVESFCWTGRDKGAERLASDIFETRKRGLGPDHAKTLQSRALFLRTLPEACRKEAEEAGVKVSKAVEQEMERWTLRKTAWDQKGTRQHEGGCGGYGPVC